MREYWECDCLNDSVHTTTEGKCGRCGTEKNIGVPLTLAEAIRIDPNILERNREAS